MRLLLWLLKKILKFPKMTQLNNFNSVQDNDGLMSIEDLKALRLRKKKLESDKKARKYILEINHRFRKMKNKKSNEFFKSINPFKKAV